MCLNSLLICGQRSSICQLDDDNIFSNLATVIFFMNSYIESQGNDILMFHYFDPCVSVDKASVFLKFISSLVIFTEPRKHTGTLQQFSLKMLSRSTIPSCNSSEHYGRECHAISTVHFFRIPLLRTNSHCIAS